MKISLASFTTSACVAVALASLPAAPVYGALPVQEVAALDALFAATGGNTTWNEITNWNGLPGTECQRFGVTCDAGENHVIRLVLNGNGLVGPLPDELWDLTSLTHLRMSANSLQGSLSPSINALSQLTQLSFEGNGLTGSLPAELGDLTALEQLLLSGNGFTGSIPVELGQLQSLERLLLGGNDLSGQIPSQLADASALTALSLENNDLSGPIPDLGVLSLTGINLSNNQLTGPIPSWLASMHNLIAIRMTGNQLIGTVPTDWQNLQSLTAINLDHNQLTGSIPTSLSTLGSLEFLGLSNNQLTGALPTSLSALQSLEILDLSANQITGTIPSDYGSLSALTLLNLGNNALQGSIPTSFGNLSNLRLLAIFSNQLTGNIPTELGDLSQLEQISLGGNQLDGAIPSSIGNLSSLAVLSLTDNLLSGSIPTELSGLTQLELLFLGANALTGPIPTLDSLVNLRDVRLSNNALSGAIPGPFDPLDSLTRFDVRFNDLSGSIPADIGGASALEFLLLNNNQLSGAIPPSIGDLSNLKQLTANDNQLSGVLPAEINQLSSLAILNLIDNRLDGDLPFMGGMSALEGLFFSSNGLTGADASLATLAGITEVRSELNRLTADADLTAFLDARQPGAPWQNSQTVAPDNVSATAWSAAAVTVAWDPILYQAQAGGYIVSYSTTAGGPYTFGGMTANKAASSLIIGGLEAETTYFFVVQTQTDAHSGNQRTLVSPLSQEISATTLDDDLLAHWPLDETTGSVAIDVTNLGHDGSVVGGPSRVAGQISGAYAFDGVDDYIQVDDPGFWDLDLQDAMTLSMWVRPDRLDTRQMLLSKDNVFEFELGRTQAGFDRYSVNFDNTFIAVGDTALSPSTWHHLAMTWDGATIRLYLNGVLDGSVPFSGPLATTNDLDIGIGARAPALIGPTLYFAGAMDDVRIYGIALSDADVAALFTPTDVIAPDRFNPLPVAILPLGTTSAVLSLETNESADCRYDTVFGAEYADMSSVFSSTGSTVHSTTLAGLADLQFYSFAVRCIDGLGNANTEDLIVNFAVAPPTDLGAGLLGLWSFDEGIGCVAADSTGARDGALGGDCAGSDVPQWIPGLDGNALSFDGDDRVSAVGAGPLTSVSISAWVRVDDALGFMAIADQRESGADGFNLFIEPGDRLFMRINGFTLQGDIDVADGTWHHVAGTYDGNEIVLYVDGFEDKRSVVGSATLDTNGADFELGGHFNDPQFSLNGDLDDVRFYDRALSSFEVLEVFELF